MGWERKPMVQCHRLFLTKGLSKAKSWSIIEMWRRSSAVEQGTHKPLVTGSNPVVATFHQKSPLDSRTISHLATCGLAT